MFICVSMLLKGLTDIKNLNRNFVFIVLIYTTTTGDICGCGIIQYNTSHENYVGEEKCPSTGDVCGGGIIQYNTSHENYV